MLRSKAGYVFLVSLAALGIGLMFLGYKNGSLLVVEIGLTVMVPGLVRSIEKVIAWLKRDELPKSPTSFGNIH